MKFEIHALSDSSATLYFEQKIDPEINNKVLAVSNWIKENPFEGLIETVPAYASVTVFYDILKVKKQGQGAFDFVKLYLSQIPFFELETKVSIEHIVEIAVDYSGEDLDFVLEYLGYEKPTFIDLHTAPIYRVYMMGFLPGFAYLGGMNETLALPRKEKPSLKVAKGSVGIAGLQTGVYPVESPGGWQIIGQTATEMFDLNNDNISLLKAGDSVKFVAV